MAEAPNPLIDNDIGEETLSSDPVVQSDTSYRQDVTLAAPATGLAADGPPVVRSASSTKPRSILRSAGAQSSAGSRRTRFSSEPDEIASRIDATERARSFIYTPPTKPVNIHQFYATIVNDYEVQPGMLFYDEETEDEDEGEDGEGEGQAAAPPPGQGQTDERPESVLTDVTIDGLGDQDIGDMSGVQMIPAVSKPKASVMSLSTVDERQALDDEYNENANNNLDDRPQTQGTVGGRPHTQGTVGFDDFSTSDAIFSTAVDEWTLDAARGRAVQDATTSDTRTELAKIMTDKLRALYNDGLRCKAVKDYGAAIRAFSRIITLKPESVLPYVQRAECYLMTADFKSAIQNYKKACTLDTQTDIYYNRLAFIYYLQGQTYFDAGQYTDALECFSQTAEIKPENECYHMRSIACLAALERHGECLALVNRRLEEEKSNTDLYVMRSRLHLMFKNIALCYFDLKDALVLDPDHDEAKQIMSEFRQEADRCHTAAVQLALQKRHRDALHKISMAIEYDPTHAEFHNIRGALHRHLSDFNSAVDDYLLALDKTNHDETSPVYQDAQRQLLLTYNDFAIQCFQKRFYEEAIMLLNKALKGEQREKGLYVNRGDCFFRTGDYQFALADYHQALEIDPSDDTVRVRISVIHNEYGTYEYQNKNYTESESRFSLAIRNNPRISHYYLSRARARYMLENHSGARHDILTSMLLNPDQENTISLTSRLFPGKTIDEIMSSKPAMAVKNTLQHILIATPGDKKLAPIASTMKQRANTVERKAHAKYRACLEEQEFNKILTQDKQKIHEQVKIALRDRRGLRHNGPMLTGPIDPNAGAVPKTGWRTFSRGISVRDGSS